MIHRLATGLAPALLTGCMLPALPGSQTVTAICMGCSDATKIEVVIGTQTPDTNPSARGAIATPSVPQAGPSEGAVAPEAAADPPSATLGDAAAPAEAPADPLADSVRAHEGVSLTPYPDPSGAWHIGYGHRITIAPDEAEALLAADLAEARTAARHVVGEATWTRLDPARRDVLAECAFVLGEAGLAGFRHMLAALRAGDYAAAADELVDSRWHAQAPARVETLAARLRSGEAGA